LSELPSTRLNEHIDESNFFLKTSFFRTLNEIFSDFWQLFLSRVVKIVFYEFSRTIWWKKYFFGNFFIFWTLSEIFSDFRQNFILQSFQNCLLRVHTNTLMKNIFSEKILRFLSDFERNLIWLSANFNRKVFKTVFHVFGKQFDEIDFPELSLFFC